MWQKWHTFRRQVKNNSSDILYLLWILLWAFLIGFFLLIWNEALATIFAIFTAIIALFGLALVLLC